MGSVSGISAAALSRCHDPEEGRQVIRARTGDEAAIRWLLTRYRTRAIRLAAHVLRRRPEEAEDVVQEALVRAFRSLNNLRDDHGFAPWLFRIVVRLCLNRRRAARWEREVSSESLATSATASAETAEEQDTRILVETLLDRLTPPLRAALVLRELEGFEYDEIARVLNVPVGTVRSRLHAARVQFRLLWTAAHQEDDDAQ